MEMKRLKKRYRNTPNGVLAMDFGRSVPSIFAKAKELGLTKTKKFMKEMYASRKKAGKGGR